MNHLPRIVSGDAAAAADDALRRIVVFNSSYTTDNLGDQIIMEAVDSHLHEMFPLGFLTGISSHDYPGPEGIKAATNADRSFVGGTNMLTSHWLRYRQIKLRLRDVYRIKPTVLMGVGWHKYQRDPDPVTRAVHRRLFSGEHLHSVRDRYTRDKLKRSGIDNVLYTGCPTMWRLSPEHVATIATTPASRCLLTVTAYLGDDRADRALVDLAVENYAQVFFWPQMYGDLTHLRAIASDHLASGRIIVVTPSLDGVRETLRSGDIDYLGSRLHCGVLALQNSVRTLIVTVDNRATEISRDTRLPTVARDRLDLMRAWIEGSDPIALEMPFDDIARWKTQFAGAAA